MHPVISLLALTLTLSRGSMAASEQWHPDPEPTRRALEHSDLLAAGKAKQDALRRRRASTSVAKNGRA